MKIYLYIKTHNPTGLKYFGKTTSKDPMKYKGSGTYWNRHLDKHGNDVSTEIVAEFEDKEKAKIFAYEFSVINNIVESKEWANLKIEDIDGGWDHINSLPVEERKIMFFSWWDKLTEEEKVVINSKKARKGEDNGMYGRNRSGALNPRFGVHDDYETYKKISESNKGKFNCKHSITGEFVGYVSVDHENVKNGLWISMNVGKKRDEKFKKDRSVQYKLRGIKPPSPVGMLWWNNGVKCLRDKNCPADGFVRGRLKMPRKQK